jgi:hypothetical protein
MMLEEHFVETLVSLVNRHFCMEVTLGDENLPTVTHAEPKQGESLTRFLNDLIRLIESAEWEGKINYYFGHELDYDTPEEFHRY